MLNLRWVTEKQKQCEPGPGRRQGRRDTTELLAVSGPKYSRKATAYIGEVSASMVTMAVYPPAPAEVSIALRVRQAAW